MFTTILIVVLFAMGLVLVVKPVGMTVSGRRRNFRVVGWGVLLLFVVVLLSNVTAVVQAKNVGVLTTFGKPAQRTLSPGLSLKAPWQRVTSIDATIQTDEYRGDGCITVRLGDGNSACVSTTNRWSVNPKEANAVYANFRSDNPTESLRDAIVTTQFKAAVNQVFGEYNPTADLAKVDLNDPGQTIKGISFTPDYAEFSRRIEQVMDDMLGDEPLVDIRSVTVSYLSLDERTQSRINDFIAEIGKTQIALQAQATNQAQAKANKILADSISRDPNVLVSKCFDALADRSFDPPAGFSCWPGGTTGVVIPGASAAK